MEEKYNDLLKKVNGLIADCSDNDLWKTDTTRLVNQMVNVLESQSKEIGITKQLSFINRIRIESFPYEMRDVNYESSVFVPKFLTKKETRLEMKSKSIARFGDGEFGIIFDEARWNFQSKSEILKEKLLNVLRADEKDFLIGLNPRLYKNLEEEYEVDADAARQYMRPKMRYMHAQLLDRRKVYADAIANMIYSQEDLDELKSIWNEKNCLFVEGEFTRSGVGNTLFDNCMSIERILCPAENAIDKYDQIINAVQKHSKNKLVLISLGPTATALSYDLYKEGYHAIDMGHVDLYYERFLRNIKRMDEVLISYKYCNCDEVDNSRIIAEPDDCVYKEQIVDIING